MLYHPHLLWKPKKQQRQYSYQREYCNIRIDHGLLFFLMKNYLRCHGIKAESDRSENTDKTTVDSNASAGEVSPIGILVGITIKRFDPETKTSLSERKKAQREQQMIFLKQRIGITTSEEEEQTTEGGMTRGGAYQMEV